MLEPKQCSLCFSVYVCRMRAFQEAQELSTWLQKQRSVLTCMPQPAGLTWGLVILTCCVLSRDGGDGMEAGKPEEGLPSPGGMS